MPYSVFKQAGSEAIDPPTLMDASIPLELSGEAVRARLCIFTDASGNECALRPDLTLPVAKHEAARRMSGETDAHRYHYNARAYRLPSKLGQPMEFIQIGTEVFGAPSTPQEDANLFALVAEAARVGGAAPASAWFGDLAIFPAFVDALDLDPAVGAALKRAFRQAGGIAALLSEDTEVVNTGLAARLSGASREEAEALVRDVYRVSGIELIGVRTMEEIVDGLMTKANAALAGGIPASARGLLEDVLAVETPIEKASAELARIAKKTKLNGVGKALDTLEARIDAMKTAAPKFLTNAKFGTLFGRRFNYYDGFLFELFAENADQATPFAAGGRYDSLIEKLSGGAVTATGIGGVVRPDRMEKSS